MPINAKGVYKMVKEIVNIPNEISLIPQSNQPIISNPMGIAQSGISDIENYIKLIEKAIDLIDKLKSLSGIKTETNTIINNTPHPSVSDMPRLNTNSNNEIIDNDIEGEKMNINIDLILNILKQIEAFKKDMTITELIKIIENDKDTIQKIINANMDMIK